MAKNIVGLKHNGSLDYISVRDLASTSYHDALILHFKAPLSLIAFGRIILNWLSVGQTLA